MSSNHRIMVVDDEPDLLTICTKYLKAWNFEVDSFTRPTEALAYFQNNSSLFSLVLTDIRMPGMSGLELAQQLLRIKPDIKIMLMTAFEINSLEVESTLPIVQYKDILQKPFKLAEICNGVKKQFQISN